MELHVCYRCCIVVFVSSTLSGVPGVTALAVVCAHVLNATTGANGEHPQLTTAERRERVQARMRQEQEQELQSRMQDQVCPVLPWRLCLLGCLSVSGCTVSICISSAAVYTMAAF
jgi:hypothetical protein